MGTQAFPLDSWEAKMKIYNVGIYARLSQENKNKRYDEGSVSIENQISMLTNFIAAMPGWIKTRTYIDDGASGVSFQRRGFTDMMEDVRSGVINLVLVKDLSRFGRNYLEAGRYLEEELPALGCRFVSLTDNIDTESGETDIMSSINAINDYFVRNTSDRIKSVMLAKAKDGQKLSGAVPYGYDRNPNARTRLVVDEYAAAIVKRVFALRLDGMGYNAIAGVLNKEGVTPPRRYYLERHGRAPKVDCTVALSRSTLAEWPSLRSPASPISAWANRTIKLMLCNEIYLGHTISMRRGTRSYRDSRTYHRDESEWIRVENTHAPIVDMETWNKVQRLNQAARETAENHQKPQRSLFSGLLVCLECNSKMGYVKRIETKKDGRIVDYGSYVCRTYMQSGCVACSSHRINEQSLKTLVIANIQEAASTVTCDEGLMQKSLYGIMRLNAKARKFKMAQEQRQLEQQLFDFDNRITKLYEERAKRQLPADDFYRLIGEIETQREAIEQHLAPIAKAIREAEIRTAQQEKWTSFVNKKPALDEIDRDALVSLIDKIEISARESANNLTSQKVKIYYKF